MNRTSPQIKNEKNNRSQHNKSLSKSQRQHSPSKPHNNSVLNGEALKIFEVPYLKILQDRFHKEIELPIDSYTSVFLAKAPQRCLQHNNVITLYCFNEHRPLCVTCMYQNNSHKKHKVMPINRVSQQLRQQMNGSLSTVAKELQNISSILVQTHSHLQRAERQFPDLMARIEKFYMEIHEMLVVKKQEQIDHIKQTWGRLRFQYSTLANNLDKINVYAMEKIASIHSRSAEENLLFNRNVAKQLARLPEIVTPNLCNYHETKYEKQLLRFQQIKKTIDNTLVFTSPFVEIISRSTSRKTSPVKSATKYKEGPKESKQKRDFQIERQKTPVRSKILEKSPQKSGSLKKHRTFL